MVTPFPSGRLSGMLGMPSSPWTPEPENITKLGDMMGVGPAGHNKDAKQHDDDDMDAHDATMNKIIHDDSGVEDPLLVTHMTWKDEQKPQEDKTGFFNLFGGKKEKLTLTQRKEQVRTSRNMTSLRGLNLTEPDTVCTVTAVCVNRSSSDSCLTVTISTIITIIITITITTSITVTTSITTRLVLIGDECKSG
jgi:hypothetical protein